MIHIATQSLHLNDINNQLLVCIWLMYNSILKPMLLTYVINKYFRS